ncbi:MAG: glycosyltransferase family 4 protein [Gemmatimonadales bacterium]
MRACFFARVKDPALFDIVDFYRNDIRILGELGFDVVRARSFSEVPWNCDLYFTWWWGTGILSLAKSVPMGRPNVLTGALQLTPEVDWWQSLGAGKRTVVRASLSLATANLAICEVELGYLRELGAPRSRLAYLGVDTDLYRPPAGGGREKLVVTVSHLTEQNVRRKRLTTVVNAVPLVLATHPDARFQIIGERGDGYPVLERLARSLRVADAIEFPGRVSTAEKVRAYQRAQVMAQATIYEGFGMSLAEAMSCGLPVVTSRRGSVPEVVGTCGRYVEPDDPEAMAREISALLGNVHAAAELGARGRERIVAHFSYEARKRVLAEVVEGAMGSRAPRS